MRTTGPDLLWRHHKLHGPAKSKDWFARESGLKPTAKGFGMIEFLIATLVLLIGLVGVLSLFGYTLLFLRFAEQNLVAKQKAREAIESIFTARNTAQVTFDQIRSQTVGFSSMDFSR